MSQAVEEGQEKVYAHSVTFEYILGVNPYRDTSCTLVSSVRYLEDLLRGICDGDDSIRDKDTEVGYGQNNREMYVRISTNKDMEEVLKQFFTYASKPTQVWDASDEATYDLAERIIREKDKDEPE
ncbi:MAG: hypothetical protein KJ709_06760 [Nanoarchaeota archaeon]|nr:hypothetical protein [Nanoarchaeota archaeon]